MKAGIAFEILVKRILISVGFSEVQPDGTYIYDGSSGQMIQGLGEAHNADVLLEPPVQTPFLNKIRLLVECKDYKRKVGLDVVRDALGLREDVNHFELVDANELLSRKTQRRQGIINFHERYSYQVAIASMSGYSIQAQKFAATHRIPLIEFDKMGFWADFRSVLHDISNNDSLSYEEQKARIIRFADNIGRRMAVAITNSGQIIFLHREIGETTKFSESYDLFWVSKRLPWKMISGGCQYCFQLPESIMEQWLANVTNEFEMRKEAINCKEEYLSNMLVYYKANEKPAVSMISINQHRLKEAKERLKNSEQ